MHAYARTIIGAPPVPSATYDTAQQLLWCEKDVGMDKALYTTPTLIYFFYLVCILFGMPSLLLCTMMHGWIKLRYLHSIYSPSTLAQPFIFPIHPRVYDCQDN